MTSKISDAGDAIGEKSSTPTIVLLTPKEAARLLKVSLSWLAKARKPGKPADSPPFIKMGRPIRYSEAALLQWLKSRQR
jgi:predicted DNA-binding transcriptional regulator AlpA